MPACASRVAHAHLQHPAADTVAAPALVDVLVALVEQQRLQNEQQRVQNEQQRVQNEQQRVQGHLMLQLVSLLPPLQREAQHARLRRLDPWTSAQRTLEEQAAFKERLLHHYDRGVPDNPPDKAWARCMVSGAELPRPLVKASHIWKRSTHGEGLDEFGLRATDVHSVRNGLLLASQLEAAFDVKRIAFRYNLLRDEFTLCVLDPALLDGARVVSDAEVRELRGYPPLERVPTFRDCEGAVLQALSPPAGVALRARDEARGGGRVGGARRWRGRRGGGTHRAAGLSQWCVAASGAYGCLRLRGGGERPRRRQRQRLFLRVSGCSAEEQPPQTHDTCFYKLSVREHGGEAGV